MAVSGEPIDIARIDDLVLAFQVTDAQTVGVAGCSTAAGIGVCLVDNAVPWRQLQRPVAILALAVVHFLTDDDQPGAVLARYRDRVVPGSFLAISEATVFTYFRGKRGQVQAPQSAGRIS